MTRCRKNSSRTSGGVVKKATFLQVAFLSFIDQKFEILIRAVSLWFYVPFLLPGFFMPTHCPLTIRDSTVVSFFVSA